MSDHKNPVSNYEREQWKSPLRWGDEEAPKRGLETKVLEMARQLEDNVNGLQNEIETFGGEAALEQAIEKDKPLAGRWENRITKLKRALIGIGVVAGVAGFEAITQAHDIKDQRLAVGLTATLVILINLSRRLFEYLEGETMTGKPLRS